MSQCHCAPKGGDHMFEHGYGLYFALLYSTSSQAGLELNPLGNLDT